MPPAGPFLSGQKGAKEPVKAGDSDFPRLNNPPLETAKKGELRFPLLGTSPRLFSWWSSGGGGLLRNAPAAPAGLSLPYLPFSTLVGAAFMAARGRPQGSPLRGEERPCFTICLTICSAYKAHRLPYSRDGDLYGKKISTALHSGDNAQEHTFSQ